MIPAGAFPHAIPFIDALGVEFLGARDGQATLALSLQPQHLNSLQVAHGGVLMSLLDVVMVFAGRSLFGAQSGGVTVDLSTSFLQPAPAAARLTATGTAYHRTRTLAFCQAEVRDAGGLLIARGMGTFKYRAAPA